MPKIGFNVYQPGVTNLIPSQIATQQQKDLKRQQNMQQIQQVFKTLQQYGELKKQTTKQEKYLKDLGILKDVQETVDPGTPEWNKIAKSMMKKNIVVSRASGALPTGKTDTVFDQESLKNLPEGITLKDIFSMPGVTLKGGVAKKPTWGQEQKIASIRTGLQKGFVTIGRDFGEPTSYPIKTVEDAYKAIADAKLDPSLFQAELAAIAQKTQGAGGTGQVDSYGFTINQEKKAKGKTYKYIGNNQWQAK